MWHAWERREKCTRLWYDGDGFEMMFIVRRFVESHYKYHLNKYHTI
jgi:hypothetical protein